MMKNNCFEIFLTGFDSYGPVGAFRLKKNFSFSHWANHIRFFALFSTFLSQSGLPLLWLVLLLRLAYYKSLYWQKLCMRCLPGFAMAILIMLWIRIKNLIIISSSSDRPNIWVLKIVGLSQNWSQKKISNKTCGF